MYRPMYVIIYWQMVERQRVVKGHIVQMRIGMRQLVSVLQQNHLITSLRVIS